MLFMLFAFLFSCSTEFKVVVLKGINNPQKALDCMYYYAVKEGGFSPSKEGKGSLELVRELIKVPEKESSKKITKSKVVFLNVSVVEDKIYLKGSTITTSLNLNKKDEVAEKNVKKSSVSLSNLNLRSAEGQMVLDILYKVRRELQIEEEIEIVPENNLDREVIIKLMSSYMGEAN